MFIPFWALVAILGHISNGAAYIIDKTLLSTSFKRSATYAGTVGLLSIFVVVLMPFGVHIPSWSSWPWIILAGATFVTALWAFFSALSMGETSRIVPIIGSLIPVLTFLGTSQLLHERLSLSQLAGFGALIFSTAILAGGTSKKRIGQKAIWISILAAFLFAVSSVTIKISYINEDFINGFFYSRLIGVLTACIILLIDRKALSEVSRVFSIKRTKKHTLRNSASWLILVGQGLGSIGFVLVQYATDLGSVSVVNALQAVQYVFLVIMAFILAKRSPKLLGEDLTPASVTRKCLGILLAGIGLWLIF